MVRLDLKTTSNDNNNSKFNILGAQLMLVTIGQPLFPMFKFVAPPDETVSIDSFEVCYAEQFFQTYNFKNLGSQPIDELCCRIAACGRNPRPTAPSETCQVVKERRTNWFMVLLFRLFRNHQEDGVSQLRSQAQERYRLVIENSIVQITSLFSDFVFLVDRANLKHQDRIEKLVLSFGSLINPLNTQNRSICYFR